MGLSNSQRQANYRRRAAKQGLVRLQAYVEVDVDALVDDLAAKFKKPRYAVIEYAIKKLAEAHEDRLNRV